MKRAWLVLGGLILLALGLAGGYWFARRPTPAPQPEVISTPTPAASPEALPATASAETAPAQTIQDRAGLYSLELPDDWQVSFEDAKGVRISSLMAQSPDYKVKIDTAAEGPFTPIYYQAGAGLQVTVLDQPLSQNPEPAGAVSEKKSVTVDGVEGTFFAFKEPSTAQGQLLEVRLEKSGRSYTLRFGYNPDTLPGGQALFERIVASLRFL
jgi:hypothetical protein